MDKINDIQDKIKDIYDKNSAKLIKINLVIYFLTFIGYNLITF